MKHKIVITGASGFIGSEFVKYFVQAGYHVVALQRGVANAEQSKMVTTLYYDLENFCGDDMLADADAIIHCAYIKNNVDGNIAGAKTILTLANKYGIKNKIFISSLSASDNAQSKYGQQKWAIEKLFLSAGGCVLCLGLVVGNGGLYLQMLNHVKGGKYIPLINGGNQTIQTINIDELCKAIFSVVENSINGKYVLAHPPLTYRMYYQMLASDNGKKAKFISMPFWLVALAIRLLGALGNKTITYDSLLGLKNSKPHDASADMKLLGINY